MFSIKFRLYERSEVIQNTVPIRLRSGLLRVARKDGYLNDHQDLNKYVFGAINYARITQIVARIRRSNNTGSIHDNHPQF
ncbi:Uncharacterised protein [Legionella quateirensis]|uniref:Uncharacterized protein n=1 Tax=Legionella quateirensis TaxID=45072 RepID=A0A378KSS3_9GAMM|nr:hypothetical protein Lqua_0071 [Legionella quateirensis]STY16527.1 Uncharacterised protein [Legionella quateirensis]